LWQQRGRARAETEAGAEARWEEFRDKICDYQGGDGGVSELDGELPLGSVACRLGGRKRW